MTKEQAVALAATEWWKGMTPREVAIFQLTNDLLCMPFGDFQEAVEKALGRPVWTHEFVNRDGLLRQLLGADPAPTMEQVMDLLPKDKRIVVVGAA